MPQNLDEHPSNVTALDDVSARRAQVRAIAAAVVDAPRGLRRIDVSAGMPLQPSPRRRCSRPRRAPAAVTARPRTRVVRRVVAAVLLAAQAGILAALLTAPAFRVHRVEVTGDHLLTREALITAARVPHGSVFMVNDEAIELRLARLPWVRTATVTTDLPSTVSIAVTEWQPDVVLRHGARSFFVAANGATISVSASDVAARKGVPLLLDYRPGAPQPLMSGLVELLASAARRWPAVFGCTVDAFVLSDSNVLSVWSSTGWQAVFGALDSSEALAAIPGQLAVLAALKGRVDYLHPTVGYVDLENPSAPATGGHPGEPASLRAALLGSPLPASAPVAAGPAAPPSPTPAATPVATATPAPTAPPSPTPLVFSLPTPSPGAPR